MLSGNLNYKRSNYNLTVKWKFVVCSVEKKNGGQKKRWTKARTDNWLHTGRECRCWRFAVATHLAFDVTNFVIVIKIASHPHRRSGLVRAVYEPFAISFLSFISILSFHRHTLLASSFRSLTISILFPRSLSLSLLHANFSKFQAIAQHSRLLTKWKRRDREMLLPSCHYFSSFTQLSFKRKSIIA